MSIDWNELRDYDGSGDPVSDEVITIPGSFKVFPEFWPDDNSPSSVELWTSAGKTGTEYTEKPDIDDVDNSGDYHVNYKRGGLLTTHEDSEGLSLFLSYNEIGTFDRVKYLNSLRNVVGSGDVSDADGNVNLVTHANDDVIHGGGGGDVTAAANIKDNAIIRGDGGAKGIQQSNNLIDDDDNISASGDMTITKVDPEFRITDSGDGEYSRVTRADTDGVAARYNQVYRPPAPGGLDQKFEDGSPDTDAGLGLTYFEAQSFTTGVSITTLVQVKVYLKLATGSGDIVYCDIYLADGAHKPTGASLGQAQIAAFANSSYEQKTFSFAPEVTVLSSTEYCIVLSSPASDNQAYNWAGSSTGSYTGGQFSQSTNSGSSWNTFASYDLTFETYSGTAGTTVEATVWKSEDGVGILEEGIQTYGHTGGQHIHEGSKHIFNIDGQEKAQLDENGDIRMSGDARISGDVFIQGDVAVSGDSRVSGDSFVSGDLRVAQMGYFGDDVEIVGLSGDIAETESVETSIEELDASLFARKTSGFISWDSGASGDTYSIAANKFSIDRDFTVRIKGKEVNVNAGVETNALTPYKTNWIYAKDDGGIDFTTVRTPTLHEDYVPMFEVLWDAAQFTVVRENHPYTFDVGATNEFHDLIGTLLEGTGANITRVATGTGAAVNDRKIKMVGADVLHDHGLDTLIPDSGGAAVTLNQYYTDGSGRWILDTAQEELLMKYNNSGVSTALAENKFGAGRIYVSKDDIEDAYPKFFTVMSDTEYANQLQANVAIAAGIPEATLELFEMELAHLGYFIIKNNAAGGYIVDLIIEKSTLKSSPTGAGATNQASLVSVATTNFDNNLGPNDSTVQLALETIDDLVIASGDVIGPSSAVPDNIATFFDGSGRKLKDGGIAIGNAYSSTPIFWNMMTAAPEAGDVGQGTWLPVVTGTYPYRGVFRNTTSADGDNFTMNFRCPAGTYTLHVNANKDSNRGIVDIYIDGNVVDTWDLYAAVDEPMNIEILDAPEALIAGAHTLKFQLNGKHASSSDYYFALQGIYLQRTD